ncbi:uncharacterized protein LOC131187489 [Ahaetulla prasina]|uniref:uncharacterized protein LOC131187489 n=1 Tax=Ahaetulla prasina TaxID=499056 RepID=UPI0026497834|nr:uncharacterized protein LOC131187489 [Ahaetulla prasina]
MPNNRDSDNSDYADSSPGCSDPKRARSGDKGKGPATKSKTKQSKSSSASDKDAERRQKALERHFARAQKKAETANAPRSSGSANIPSLTLAPSLQMPCQGLAQLFPLSTTFTPTAAGIRPQGSSEQILSAELCSAIAQSIAQSTGDALNQRGLLGPSQSRSGCSSFGLYLLQIRGSLKKTEARLEGGGMVKDFATQYQANQMEHQYGVEPHTWTHLQCAKKEHSFVSNDSIWPGKRSAALEEQIQHPSLKLNFAFSCLQFLPPH